MHLNCQFCIKRQTKFETKLERNNFSADGKYEVRLMTKAELKYTGWKHSEQLEKKALKTEKALSGNIW